MRYIPAEKPNPLYPIEVQCLNPARIEFDDGRIVPVCGLTDERFNDVFEDVTSPNVPGDGSRGMGGDLR